MDRKTLYILISGMGISIKTHAEKLSDLNLQELSVLAELLKNEYGITIKEEAKDDLEKMFEELSLKKLKTSDIVIEDRPKFPIPNGIFNRQKTKQNFPPPKKGKICSKPKGNFRK